MVDTSGVDWVEYFMPGTRAGQADAAAKSPLPATFYQQAQANAAYLASVDPRQTYASAHPAQLAAQRAAQSVPTVGPPPR